MSTDFNENVIEWLEHDKYVWVTFSEKRLINRIKVLAKKRPKDVRVEELRTDSVYARIPTSWVKIQPPATISESQRQAMVERGRKLRASFRENESKTNGNG